jgi:hypothetical protein
MATQELIQVATQELIQVVTRELIHMVAQEPVHVAAQEPPPWSHHEVAREPTSTGKRNLRATRSPEPHGSIGTHPRGGMGAHLNSG